MSARTQAELSGNSSAQQSRIPSVLLQRRKPISLVANSDSTHLFTVCLSVHILILIYDNALQVRDALLRELAADHPSGQGASPFQFQFSIE